MKSFARWGRQVAPHVLLLLPLFVLLGYWQSRYAGYVKDDTFISMRYARNLALGHGLVFNYGERLEGYTNFLWVLLTVPAVWLKVDVLTWVKALSCLAGHLGIVVTYALARFFAGGRTDLYAWLAALAYALSPTVVLWSMSGMEPTLMGVLCGAGSLYAFRLWNRDNEDADPQRLAGISAAFLAAAALCRPDAHAVVIVAVVFAVIDSLRRGGIDRCWWTWGGVILSVLAPYHLFRVLYFGDLIPNTAHVKASAGPEVIERGLGFVEQLLVFALNPGIFALAALAVGVSLLCGPTRATRLWAAALGAAFMLYMIRIGRDEMKWFRLFLPVFPVVVALAGDGLRQGASLLDRAGAALEDLWPGTDPMPKMAARGLLGALLPAALAIALLAHGGQQTWDYLEGRAKWHNGYSRSSEASFQAMGRYIAKRSDPGDVAVFQDMGAAPWSAPEITWIDTIGILNQRVGQELSKIGLNPFLRGEKSRQPGGAAEIKAFERTIRDYVFERDPDWIAFVAYIPKSQRRKFRNAYNKLKRGRKDHQVVGDPKIEAHFRKRIRRNSHALGIARDDRFLDDFRFVRVWKRDPQLRTWGHRRGYWLVLYRSRDHWAQDRNRKGR